MPGPPPQEKMQKDTVFNGAAKRKQEAATSRAESHKEGNAGGLTTVAYTRLAERTMWRRKP